MSSTIFTVVSGSDNHGACPAILSNGSYDSCDTKAEARGGFSVVSACLAIVILREAGYEGGCFPWLIIFPLFISDFAKK